MAVRFRLGFPAWRSPRIRWSAKVVGQSRGANRVVTKSVPAGSDVVVVRADTAARRTVPGPQGCAISPAKRPRLARSGINTDHLSVPVVVHSAPTARSSATFTTRPPSR